MWWTPNLHQGFIKNYIAADCESVGHFLWNCWGGGDSEQVIQSTSDHLFRAPCIINNLGNEFEQILLSNLVKSYIIDIWELRKSKLYDSGTGPLQHRSRPGRDTTCQGKSKFGKLGGEKSCIVVYGSARSSECEAHGPSATATIWVLIIAARL